MADVRSHPTAKPASRTILNLGNLPPKRTTFEAVRTPSRVNPDQPPWPAYRGYVRIDYEDTMSLILESAYRKASKHEFSFAHDTMGKRLPTILQKSIDDTVRTLNEEHEEARIVDLQKCIDRMQTLMVDLQTNQTLRVIKDDGEGDVALWNKEIAKFFRGKNFMNAPWLFAEAYKYRRLHECFSISTYWKDYDVFFRQKCDTFGRSSTAVFELSTRFAEPFAHLPNASEEERLKAAKLVFHELTQVCLWGNATDLSLLINMTEDDIKNLQSTGGEHLAETEKNILGNDLDRVWEGKVSKMKGGRIDFVLDNAGFELYCDCVYADWLIQSGIASEIHFHGKRFAWFVSDVTQKDWSWLLNSMMYGSLFPDASDAELASLRQLAERWKKYEREGKWVYEQHPFWCTGYAYWSLPSEAPDLFIHLADSDLVFFKGDLNARRLCYDCQTPASIPFEQAIGPMSSADGAPPIVSLRTIKSDIVVGVEQEKADRLDKEEPGWRISGKYAVVLYSEGTPGEPNP